MAQTVREVTTTETEDTNDHSTNIAARVISFIGGVVMTLLGLRFLLMLLGANRGNAIVDFIYSASYPFAVPFFGMFSYEEEFGRARFEYETLVAIIVYALITWGLVRLVTMGNRRRDV